MLVSGMIIGSAFTLFVVPSIYMLLARIRERTAPATAGEPGEGVPEWAASEA
jgi:hypothetical protein